MPNIINLRLLDNKSVVADMQGIPLGSENSYKIVAGEKNATKFKIISTPLKYQSATYTVYGVNSKGYRVDIEIKDNEFTLPIGMAVSGYGYLQFECFQGEEEVPFLPFKIKVWETINGRENGISSKGVQANPNEESTEELNSILIDGTVYSIPKGGEGSGIRTLETAPTTATEGYVGEIVQVIDGTAYQCTAITDNNYTWVKILLETAINYIVKKGLTENTETLTDEEKTKATKYIGALKKVTTNTGLVRAYTILANGTQETRNLATSAGSMQDGRIPLVFGENNTQGNNYVAGHLLTAFPTMPYHCVNLNFIERKVKKYTHNITITFNNEASIEYNLNFEIHNSQKTAYTEISQVIDLALIPKRSSGSGGEPIYPIINFWDTGFAFVSLGASGTLSTNAQFVQFSNCTFVDTVI